MPRSIRGALYLFTGLLFLLGAVTAAALLYDRAHEGELLPGIVVGEISAGGRSAAVIAGILADEVPAVGSTKITIAAGDHTSTVTLEELGLRTDAAEAVARAEEEADRMGVASRVWHRLLNKPVEKTYPVQLTVERSAVRRRVGELAKEVKKDPVDAVIDTSTGMVTIQPSREGKALDVESTIDRVFDTAAQVANGELRASGPRVVATVRTLTPKVSGFDDVILVRVAENKLYHYENGNLVKDYVVATGTPKYPTPQGTYSVVLKRKNPTWVNPDPTGWGKSLPARIGPGPRNPLGTRAMNLDAPGIRIHGTSNVASLGRAASHGCIRMAMGDVEELFDKVEQGTPVAIIEGPPPAALPAPAAGQPAPAPDVNSTFGDPNAPVDLEAG